MWGDIWAPKSQQQKNVMIKRLWLGPDDVFDDVTLTLEAATKSCFVLQLITHSFSVVFPRSGTADKFRCTFIENKAPSQVQDCVCVACKIVYCSASLAPQHSVGIVD